MIAAKYKASEKLLNCFNGVRVTCSEIRLRLTCDSGWIAVFTRRPASVSNVNISYLECLLIEIKQNYSSHNNVCADC